MAKLKAAVLGVNTTKSYITYALVASDDAAPTVIKADRIAIENSGPAAIVHQLCGIFDSLAAEQYELEVAICECSSGAMASSVAAIKAEALVEYACEKHGRKYSGFHPNGFRTLLGCADGIKWQQRARELFNGNGEIKYFATGIDGAATAAFRRLRDKTASKI